MAVPMYHILGGIVSWEANEKDGDYQFRLISNTEENGAVVAQKLFRKIVDGVCCKTLDEHTSDWGTSYQIKEKGSQIAIIALGDFFQLGEQLAKEIKSKMSMTPTLINPRYITGLDEELLESLKAEHQMVITLEDGILDGGFGEKIAGFYGPTHMKVLNYGLKKEFLDRYNVEDVLKKNRLTPEHILDDVFFRRRYPFINNVFPLAT